MASNTSLTIFAIPPSGEANQKTWTGVLETNALSGKTLEDGTTGVAAAANESMYYDLANTTDLDEASTDISGDNQVDWTLVGKYTNTGSTPDDNWISNPVTIQVDDDNFSA